MLFVLMLDGGLQGFQDAINVSSKLFTGNETCKQEIQLYFENQNRHRQII